LPIPTTLTTNNLPDDWEAANHVTGGEYGDPDNDGLGNFQEYVYGTNPMAWGGVQGYLSRDVWAGISGRSVSALTLSSNFLLTPTLSELWYGSWCSPSAYLGNYGQRLRGTVTAPVTGYYFFWVAGDDSAELWLSSDSRKFQKQRIAYLESWADVGAFDNYPYQRSAPILLQAGQSYYIEILHKQGAGPQHVEVVWQQPGGPREAIPAQYLTSYAKDLDDLDDDDLPDSWERQVGLDPVDNGSIDPKQASYADFDGNGRTNREVYLLASDSTAPDPNWAAAQSASGSAAVVVAGNWVADASTGYLRNYGVRGSIDFAVDLAEAGLYSAQLELDVDSGLSGGPYPLHVEVDGRTVGWFSPNLNAGTPRTQRVLLPWLGAGRHTVRVTSDNVKFGRVLIVRSFNLEKAVGDDTDNDGRVDWVAALLSGRNGFKAGPATSPTSPACVEGLGTPDYIAASDNLAVQRGVNGAWYANVDLPADGSARTLAFTFENGALQASRAISWSATNLAKADSLTIRQGDSLRLTAFEGDLAGDQTVSIYLDETLVGEQAASSPLVQRFDTNGAHSLRAVYSSATGAALERTVSVKVIGGAFANSPVGLVNQVRNWANPALPAGLEFEFDTQIHLSTPIAENGGTTLPFLPDSLGTYYGVARIGSGGPILAQGVIRSESVSSANQTQMRQVGSLEDGSRIVEMKVVMSNLQPDTEVHLEIFVGGVVFQDTGATSRVLTAADFDELGVATVIFVQAPWSQTSTCHKLYVTQGSSVLGGVY
jgi:hypothetical protein